MLKIKIKRRTRRCILG